MIRNLIGRIVLWALKATPIEGRHHDGRGMWHDMTLMLQVQHLKEKTDTIADELHRIDAENQDIKKKTYTARVNIDFNTKKLEDIESVTNEKISAFDKRLSNHDSGLANINSRVYALVQDGSKAHRDISDLNLLATSGLRDLVRRLDEIGAEKAIPHIYSKINGVIDELKEINRRITAPQPKAKVKAIAKAKGGRRGKK